MIIHCWIINKISIKFSDISYSFISILCSSLFVFHMSTSLDWLISGFYNTKKAAIVRPTPKQIYKCQVILCLFFMITNKSTAKRAIIDPMWPNILLIPIAEVCTTVGNSSIVYNKMIAWNWRQLDPTRRTTRSPTSPLVESKAEPTYKLRPVNSPLSTDIRQ